MSKDVAGSVLEAGASDSAGVSFAAVSELSGAAELFGSSVSPVSPAFPSGARLLGLQRC